MRNGRLLLLLVISACDSPTEPLFPPGGEYALVAGSEHGYPAAVPEEMLPFDYDVTGDGSCVFRVSAGSLVIDGETYSIDLQQDVVSCTYGWQPMSHEGGRLARYVSSGPSTGWFAFQVTSGQGGWLLDGRYDNGSVYVELAKPEGGRVSYLRFEPAE